MWQEDEGRLVQLIEEERARRTEEDARLASAISGELGELHRLIETEKRSREEGTRALISLIEKYSKRLQVSERSPSRDARQPGLLTVPVFLLLSWRRRMM